MPAVSHPPRLSAYDAEEHHGQSAPRIIAWYTWGLSFAFLLASVIAAYVTHETDFLGRLWLLLTTPSKLVTDYFRLGGLTVTLFNTAMLGFVANLLITLSRVRSDATTFAAYMLVVAHGFYGLNLINVWSPMLGVLVYCLLRHKPVAEHVHIALFATALGPFISDFLFRYTHEGSYVVGQVRVSVLGVVLSLLFGLAAGFVVPALLPGTSAMHRGFNLFKAGLAIGILGIFVYSFLYRSLGIPAPAPIVIENAAYDALPYGYRGFMNVFFAVVFALTLLMGWWLNGRSLRGYGPLLRSTGYGDDFLDLFGMPVCLINVGVYGLLILGYLNLVFILPELLPFLPAGVGFTGPTAGVVFAALTFAADGQQPRTVWPIALGYVLLLAVVCGLSAAIGQAVPWTLSTQAYINGLAFATGLCTFTGKYGIKVGVLAGFLSAVICTSTADMHGGFVLYNGGFNAGLTALVLLPILDFYQVKEKR